MKKQQHQYPGEFTGTTEKLSNEYEYKFKMKRPKGEQVLYTNSWD